MSRYRAVLMFCVLLAWPSWPSAAEIVVFGNSLSDAGNVFAASTRDPSLQPDPPSPPYSQERMSNGGVWVKQSADVLDKVLTTPRKLLICGGKVPISKSNPIVAKMIELAGGANGRLAVIPTAKRSNGNLEAWTSVGIGSAFNFHAADRDEANSSEFYSQLDNATAVWIEGGSQGELEDRYIGTATEIALYRFLERGNAIGGTSAGAAIQTRLMRRTSSNGEPVEGTGFDFLFGAYVDQHFWQRNRQGLVIQMLTNNPGYLGIGIDENTGLLVEGRSLTAIADPSQSGHHSVSIYLSSRTDPIQPDYVMNNGDKLDLVNLLNELKIKQ